MKHSSGTIPLVSKEIVEVITIGNAIDDDSKMQKIVECEIEESSSVSVESPSSENIGWGRWYGLKELENATDGFSEGNVIGEGGYGIVYRGILHDGSVVAVKNLLNNKYVTNHIFHFHSCAQFYVYVNFLYMVNLLMVLIICLHVKYQQKQLL